MTRMTQVTLQLPEELVNALSEVCRDQQRSTDDVVAESLRRYLAVEQLYKARRKLVPLAEAQGIFSDEDVFKAFPS